MKRLNLFLANLIQDFKLFAFLWCMTQIFRSFFLLIFNKELVNIYWNEIIECFVIGGRLSFNSIGWVTMISIVMISIPSSIFLFYNSNKIRTIYTVIIASIYCIVYFFEIPYYFVFQSAYDLNVMNIFYDDYQAVILSAINDYHLLECILGILICIFLNFYICKRIFKNNFYNMFKRITDFKIMSLIMIFVICSLYLFVLLMRFGGSFTGYNAIKYDNAQRFDNNLLNVAVLDSGQVVKRFFIIYKQINSIKKEQIFGNDLRYNIKLLDGNSEANDLKSAFRKIKQESPYFKEKPKKIILIIGESFGNWPVLEKYQKMNLMPEYLSLMRSENSFTISEFLSDGANTGAAVTSLLSGLQANDLHINYLPQTYKEPYPTGLGIQMQKLGYKTCFWYGGFSDWQNIKKFVLSQGFDEFYGVDSYRCNEINVWGCSDKELFENVLVGMKNEAKDEYVLHVILTTSNHAPYNIDIVKEGFPEQKVKKSLPDNVPNNKDAMTHLGYIWYTDKYIGKFVQDAKSINADTLFMITGDHSERFDFSGKASIEDRSSLPFLFYHNNIKKQDFSSSLCGSQLQIAPTLINLIAPVNFEYFALRDSLFDNNKYTYNFKLLIENGQWKFSNKIEEISGNMIAEKRRAEILISSKWILQGPEFY